MENNRIAKIVLDAKLDGKGELTGDKVTNKCTVILYLFFKFIYLPHRHVSAIP